MASFAQPNIIAQALHYLDMGCYSQAREILYPAMADSPNDGYLLYLLAICHLGLDEYAEALDYCSEALCNGYVHDQCHYLEGKIYMEQKLYIEAEQAFLAALHNNPLSVEVMATYGFLMLKTGHVKKAEQLMGEALRLEPDNSVVLHYHFHYYLVKNKREDLRHVLGKYMSPNNSELSKLVKVGLYELSRKNYKSAKENFRQAYMLDRTNTDLLVLLQDLHRRSSIWYLHFRLIEKLGGSAVVWVGAILTVMVLRVLKLHALAGIIAIAYFILVVYSWVVFGVAKAKDRWGKRYG